MRKRRSEKLETWRKNLERECVCEGETKNRKKRDTYYRHNTNIRWLLKIRSVQSEQSLSFDLCKAFD